MSVFLLADVQVTDDSWIPNYAANVHIIVHKHGGKYLSRSGNIETIEGAENVSSLVALLEFPSKEALENFVNDPDYAPYAQARQAGSVSSLRMIDDTDVAGTISYLTAG